MNHPSALLENTGFVFPGESAWPPSLLTPPQARKLAATPNACGRPNSDVLRRRFAVIEGKTAVSWQIDFPEHFTEQEAALYEKPFALLRQRSVDSAWLNPHANPTLRRALARVSRTLAMPAGDTIPEWRWIEEDVVPDVTLLAVARDDDFTHGILQSTLFAAWHHAHRTRLGPVQIVESFPFPWPPATALGSLTIAQEEQRHAVARAARGGDQERLNAAVLAAYGWPLYLNDAALLEKLTDLNRQRAK